MQGVLGSISKNNLPYTKHDDLCITQPEFETLWVESEVLHQHNIVCGIVYRHPGEKLEMTLNFLYETSGKINKEGKSCMLMGDFKIDLLKYDSHTETEDFVNTLGSHAFHPQILKPTRITSHSATLIDNIFSNSLEYHVISGNIVCGITDHLPYFLIINKISALPENFKMFKRDYSKLNSEALIAELQNVNWSEVLYCESEVTNISTVFQNFHTCISEVINKHAPIRRYTRKEIRLLSKSWVTSGIRTSIRTKEKFYKGFIETRNLYFLTKYKYYRNQITCLLRISKKNYYHSYFLANSKNIKNIWTGIKELITLKPKGLNPPSKIMVDNLAIKDPKSIAAAFNKYLSQIGSKLAHGVPHVDIEPLAFLGPSLPNSFVLFSVTEKEIEHEITSLNSSKASGLFSIPSYMLKLLKTCLSFPLQLIYNLSFSTGRVPDQFKIANVIPVFKKDSVTCMSNYRPISLLSIFNKMLEKLMYKRLISFINKHNILCDNQFGFREKHSTVHANLLINYR